MSKRTSPTFSKELDQKKQVSVTQFNGMNLVDIREFYTDKASGERKPGKKGIALSEQAWNVLMESRDEVFAALQELGGKKLCEDKVEETTKVETKRRNGKEVKSEEIVDDSE